MRSEADFQTTDTLRAEGKIQFDFLDVALADWHAEKHFSVDKSQPVTSRLKDNSATSDYLITDDGNITEVLKGYTNTYSIQGELLRTDFKDGSYATLTWKSGMLAEVKRSDGFTLKFENGSWNEYDTTGSATSIHFVKIYHADGSASHETGSIKAEQLRRMSDADWGKMIQTLYRKEFPAPLKIDTSEASQPVSKDSDGKILATHLGDKTEIKYEYDTNTGALTSVILPNKFSLQLHKDGRSWTYNDQSGKVIAENITAVELRKTGELCATWPGGSRYVWELNGQLREIEGKIDPLQTDDVALAIFGRIDLDGDQLLSKKELGKAVQNHTFSGVESQVVTALFEQFERISSLSLADPLQSESDTRGISLSDLKSLQELMPQAAERQYKNDLVKWWTHKGFASAVDRNNDGFLSRFELDEADKDKQKDSVDEEVLTILSEELKRRTAQKFDISLGFKIEELRHFGLNDRFKFDPETMLDEFVSGLYHRIKNSEERVASQAQADPITQPFVTRDGAVDYMAVKQGGYGDCYLLAPIAATAATRPDLLRQLITSNNDGTYTVKFQNYKPIVVSQRTVQQMALGNGGSRSGDFPGIIEDAFGELDREVVHLNYEKFTLKGEEPAIPLHGVNSGGFPEIPLQYLTGKTYHSVELSTMSLDELKKTLSTHILGTSGAPLTVCKDKTRVAEDDAFFAPHHAYGLVSFDPNCGKEGTVTVMNPWGNVRSFTLEQFRQHFYNIQKPQTH